MLRPRFALLLPLLLLSLAGCGDDDGGGDDGDGDGTTADLGTTPTPAERSTPAAYVRGDHPRLIIELDVAPGLAPRAGVADLVTGALGEILDKPGGITVSADDTLSEDQMKDIWTADDLQTLAVATFDQVGADDAAVFQTLWLSGRYEADGVLAVAWANRYIAIFPETIESACGALLPAVQERICREAEAAVWTHESGHVIGLVNTGIPMVEDHEDPDHPGHTTDEDGVMYWAYETASVSDLLLARMGTGGDRLFHWGPASLADVAAFQ